MDDQFYGYDRACCNELPREQSPYWEIYLKQKKLFPLIAIKSREQLVLAE